MNKKTLVTKILEFIYKANIKYKKLNNSDIWLLVLITFMSMSGMKATIITIFIILGLRAIYEFDILARLGVIQDEEENKTNDEEIIKNVR